MANILTGIIKVEAPGVEQTTNKVAGAVQRVERSIKAASPVTQQFNQLLREAPNFALSAQVGILSLSNNLPYFTEAIQKARAQGQGFGSILKQMGTGLVSVTGIATLAVTALTAFGQSLFGNKKQAEENKVALDALQGSIDQVKDSTEQLTNAIQFQNQLGAINIKIIGFGDIDDLRQQSIAQQNLIYDFQQNTLKAQKNYSTALELNTKERTEKTQEMEDKALRELREAQDNEEDARNRGRIIFRQIELQKKTDREKAIDEQKRLNDKELAEWERFRNETISRAKELAAFFKDGFIVPQFTIFQNKQQAFEVAKKFLDSLQDQIPGINTKLKIPISFELHAGANQELKDHIKSLSTDIPDIAKSVSILPSLKGFEEAKKHLTDLQKGFIETGKAISSFITPAIDGMIDAIGRGENAWAAFGQAVKQILTDVIAKLIQTAILSAIVSAISGGASNVKNGGMNFISAFKNIFGGFRAGGGPVQAGRAYVVGERRPELFIPNASGVMLPDTNAARGFGGMGQMQLSATVRGQDLVFVLAQANASQFRQR